LGLQAVDFGLERLQVRATGEGGNGGDSDDLGDDRGLHSVHVLN